MYVLRLRSTLLKEPIVSCVDAAATHVSATHARPMWNQLDVGSVLGLRLEFGWTAFCRLCSRIVDRQLQTSDKSLARRATNDVRTHDKLCWMRILEIYFESNFKVTGEGTECVQV